MRMRCARVLGSVPLVFAVATGVFAQQAPPIQGVTTTKPALTVAETVNQLVQPVGAPHVGEALGLATKLAVGTAPFGAAAGGFALTLDPSGLQVPTATTFGPAFGERALTVGEGTVAISVNVQSATFDHLGSLDVDGLQLRSVSAASPAIARTGVSNVTFSANTVVFSGRVGVTDHLDVGVSIPVVAVKANGTTNLKNGNGEVTLFATGNSVGSGLGDVAGLAKYRFHSFGKGQPDPGGLAAMVTLRLPTGDTDNLRGLGVTRTLVSLIASSGRGKLRPHGNVGFEVWSKGVTVASDYAPGTSVTARHRFEYIAGVEYEAAPKATLIVDVLGGGVLGGGRIDIIRDTLLPTGAVASQSAAMLPEGIWKLDVAPGVRVNLKGKALLSLNVLIALSDGGLHARVTPFAGIDMGFK